VHRWATAHITGSDSAEVPNQTKLRTYDDLLGFYLEGHAKLLDALRAAPDDLRAMTFLNDAPSPRMFWARRQAHETTIHAVDAIAASREGLPSATILTVPARLATDGIDELLRGFYTRGSCKLYDGHDETVVVTATDAGRRWVLHVGSTLSVSDDVEGRDVVASVAGTAAEVYLALWNRGDEITLRGDDRFLQRWREAQRVQWR
jgi:Mycothiol maleylpyruvate isomerase N-terminal domain/MDMPI C-terminal domain